jgi:prefoldin subunit 5
MNSLNLCRAVRIIARKYKHLSDQDSCSDASMTNYEQCIRDLKLAGAASRNHEPGVSVGVGVRVPVGVSMRVEVGVTVGVSVGVLEERLIREDIKEAA